MFFLLILSVFLNGEQSDQNQLDYMKDVVWGQYLPDYGAQQKVITSSDLDKYNSRDLADILRNVPGLSVSAGGKSGTKVSIRGFANEKVKVLINGQPISENYYGMVDLSTIPVEQIEKVIITPSSISPQYAEGMGGIINIITKEGWEPPQLKISVEAIEDLGHYLEISQTHPLGSFTIMNLNVSWEKVKGFKLPEDFVPDFYEDGGLRENSDRERLHFQGTLRRILKNQQYVSLGFGVTRQDFGCVNETDRLPIDRFVDWSNNYVNSRARLNLRKNIIMYPAILYSYYMDRLKRYSRQPFFDENLDFDSVFKIHTMSEKVEIDHDIFTKNKLTYGNEFRYIYFLKKPDIDEDLERYKYSINNAYLIDEINPVKPLYITPGIGFSTLFNSQHYTYDINPSLGLKYFITNNLSSRVSMGRTIKYPTLQNLYSETKGNPDLKSEYAYKFEAGSEITIPIKKSAKVTSSASVFRNYIHDLIYLSYQDDLDGKFANTSSSVGTWGADFQIGSEIELNRNTRIIPNAMLSSLFFKQGNLAREEYTEIKAYNPRYQVSFDNTMFFKLLLPASITYVIKGSFTRYDHIQAKMKDYTVHDLKSEVYMFKETMSLYLQISNIYDKLYEEKRDYPQPGRTFNFGIRYNYKNKLF
ncbi:MAG: TonB-dependent receptor [Candidatus Coatesbacteria bacterium]|nr:TonB-dependent receptor [Candidatus Coatesbacteria bacterium]